MKTLAKRYDVPGVSRPFESIPPAVHNSLVVATLCDPNLCGMRLAEHRVKAGKQLCWST